MQLEGLFKNREIELIDLTARNSNLKQVNYKSRTKLLINTHVGRKALISLDELRIAEAYMNEDMLVVTMDSNIQQVEVYDLTGNRIAEGTTDAGSFTTKLSAKAGIYVVKVLSENNLYTTKIAVK